MLLSKIAIDIRDADIILALEPPPEIFYYNGGDVVFPAPGIPGQNNVFLSSVIHC